MPLGLTPLFRLCCAALIATLALHGAARAEGVADFDAAVAAASDQYRVTLQTLETQGREHTAAEVARLRAAWQAVADSFSAHRDAFADAARYDSLVMQVDASLVGAMIVIDIGSRDAARSALAPIADTLAELHNRATAPAR